MTSERPFDASAADTSSSTTGEDDALLVEARFPVSVYGAAAMGAQASRAVALGAFAVGALALGAGAIGALAIGRLAVRRLSIQRSCIERLEIDELFVRRLHVEEVIVAGRCITPDDISTRSSAFSKAQPRHERLRQ